MEEDKADDLEQIVHKALVKCAEVLHPDTDGFYELSEKYIKDVQTLYFNLLQFDSQYGWEVNT